MTTFRERLTSIASVWAAEADATRAEFEALAAHEKTRALDESLRVHLLVRKARLACLQETDERVLKILIAYIESGHVPDERVASVLPFAVPKDGL